MSRKVVPWYQCESPNDNQHQAANIPLTLLLSNDGLRGKPRNLQPFPLRSARQRAVVYSTETLSAGGMSAPESHCSFATFMLNIPQQPPPKACETKASPGAGTKNLP